MEAEPTRSDPLRVLVLVQGTLGERLAGPEIRAWEIVRAFARDHEVTAAAQVDSERSREGIRVVPYNRRTVRREIVDHDVVIGPVIPPYALVSASHCLKVADLYDPVWLELATAGGRAGRRRARRREHLLDLNMRAADLLVCANEPQEESIRERLEGVGRTTPPPPLLTVPMGLPDAPRQGVGRPLRERFPAIGADDPLVLWWGSVWRWLDAATAIRAIGQLSERRPDLRMVITAGKPANAATDPLNGTEDARRLASELGLLDRHVFFLDEWVPFDERHHYIGDATVGITLHADTPEAPLAARARYMDCVWASLPLVLARGDQMADRLADAGAAILVSPGDTAAAAAAIETLIGVPGRLEVAQEGCAKVAAEFHWPSLLEPLVGAVEDAAAARDGRSEGSLRAWVDAADYYCGRAVDLALLSS
jgi:glycosyltransferase involved in cell wall biosynthesis